MESQVMIRDVDIGLFGGFMVEIYLDNEYYKQNDVYLQTDYIVDNLNKESRHRQTDIRHNWSDEPLYSEILDKTRKSSSAFYIKRKKYYVTFAHLMDTIIDHEFFETVIARNESECVQELQELEKTYYEICKFLKNKRIVIQDIEMKFNCFGDVVFFAVVRLRNENFTLENYSRIASFVQKIARYAY